MRSVAWSQAGKASVRLWRLVSAPTGILSEGPWVEA